MTDYEPATAKVQLIKRHPAATARIMFETVKQAIDECDSDERHELLQELFAYAVSNGARHDDEYHLGYAVCLDRTIRDEEAQRTLEALMCVRHVISVEPVEADLQTSFLRQQERHRLHELLMGALTSG